MILYHDPNAGFCFHVQISGLDLTFLISSYRFQVSDFKLQISDLGLREPRDRRQGNRRMLQVITAVSRIPVRTLLGRTQLGKDHIEFIYMHIGSFRNHFLNVKKIIQNLSTRDPFVSDIFEIFMLTAHIVTRHVSIHTLKKQKKMSNLKHGLHLFITYSQNTVDNQKFIYRKNAIWCGPQSVDLVFARRTRRSSFA